MFIVSGILIFLVTLVFSLFLDFTMTEDNLRDLAGQLSCPSGEAGTQVADMMNETNRSMTLHSIHLLAVVEHDAVLEIGHGNAGHLPFLFDIQQNIHYTGLEISELMYQEALTHNQNYMEKSQASFRLYDGNTIPFPNDYFHKIFTVNTIYFWNEPLKMMSELYRVCKPKGRINITFAEKKFMETLPFSSYGFQLYSTDTIINMAAEAQLTCTACNSQTEHIQHKMGEWVDRTFTTLTFTK